MLKMEQIISKKCCVHGCPGKDSPAIKTFAIPKSDAEAWCKNLKIPLINLKVSDRVCSRHFEKQWMGKKKLISGARPTLDLGHNDIQNPIPENSIRYKPRKCSIDGCNASSPLNTLFSFPKDPLCFQVWIQKCTLKVEVENHLHKFICGKHFEKNMFIGAKLKVNAIPTLEISRNLSLPNESNRLTEPENTAFCAHCHKFCQAQEYYRRKLSEVTKNFNESVTKHENEKKDLLDEISNLKRKLQGMSTSIENYKLNSVFFHEDMSEAAKDFCNILTSKGSVHKSNSQKRILQNINYLSNKAYDYMREDLNFNFPCQKTLYNWSPIKQLKPGIDITVMATLKEFVVNLPREHRNCAIVFDEIGTRRELEFNNKSDSIDGFEDLGNKIRRKAVASKALFFMLKGLIKPWKFTHSFYFTENGMSGDNIAKVLRETINSVHQVGLTVCAVISDQGSNNLRCFKILSNSKTVVNTFQHNGNDIYICEDYCHIIKSIRNTLIKHNIVTTDGIVSWSVLREFHKIDTTNSIVRMAPKLSHKHIAPEVFEKMRVNLAVQVFSHTVSSGILYCHKQNLFQNEENKKNAVATANFFKTMNDCFDLCDSKYFGNNHKKQPATLQNGILVKIESYIEYFQNIKIDCPNKTKNMFVCVKGMTRALQSMLSLANNLLAKAEIKYFAFGRLNQDCIENVFAAYRSKLGNNTNPSPREIQYLSARIMSMHITQKFLTNKNCEESAEDLASCNWDFITVAPIVSESENENSFQEITAEGYLNFENADLKSCVAADAAARYFTGYGIKAALLKKFECEKCFKNVSKLESTSFLISEGFLTLKNFGIDKFCLHNPSDIFFEVCKIHFEVFKQIFNEGCINFGILQSILDSCVQKTPNWFDEKDECYHHKLQITKHLLKVLLRKHCRWFLEFTDQKKFEKRKIRQGNIQKHEPKVKKMRLLKN